MFRKKFIGICVCLLLAVGTAVCASQSSQLNKLNKNIRYIRTDLKKAHTKKTHLQIQLKKTEITELHIKKQLRKTKYKLAKNKKLLRKLQVKAKLLLTKKQLTQTALRKQIHAAFLLSRQPYLKLLLDPSNANQTQRNLMYFRYMTKAQLHTIKKLQHSLSAYQKHQALMQRQHVTLLTLKGTQIDNQRALKKIQTDKRYLISRINQQIKTKNQKLSQLIQDKLRLERTIKYLSRKSIRKSLIKQSFERLRGKLQIPATGHLRHYFGTKINQSELRWKGTLIDAQAGTSVHAVAAGQVVFAKWLPGYGLLIIINHGNGYMTLYGRNQTLLKKAGDWVTANEKIATVGSTGGFRKPALYFSIRHNAKPLNPARWCRS